MLKRAINKIKEDIRVIYEKDPAATNIVFGKIAGNNAAMFVTENK